jgi:hypothetical protein
MRGQSDCIEIVADLHFASAHSKWTARNVEKCQKNMLATDHHTSEYG